MTAASKLTLSAEEQQLVINAGWILTKRSIIDKVMVLLGEQAAFAQQYILQKKLPAEVVNTSPKIAKGENYRELPWVMLDYPRVFNKTNVFAIRTLFWWGNFFSVTLHLSGWYKEQFEKKIISHLPLQKGHAFYICTGTNEWEHHFHEDNYTVAAAISEQEAAALFASKAFIKIACKYPLQQWNEIPLLLQASFKKLLDLTAD